MIIGPIFVEAELLPQRHSSMGGGSWQTWRLLTSIPHLPLVRSLSRRIADGRLLHIIRGWHSTDGGSVVGRHGKLPPYCLTANCYRESGVVCQNFPAPA